MEESSTKQFKCPQHILKELINVYIQFQQKRKKHKNFFGLNRAIDKDY